MAEMLRYLVDPADTDRAFVPFSTSDKVVLLANNFGGLSGLEFDAMVNVTLQVLKRDWNIVPVRIYAGIMEGSLNGQGFSITLGNMSGMAKAMGLQDAEIIDLLDAPTSAPAWPKNGYQDFEKSTETEGLKAKAQSAAASESCAQSKGPPMPAFLIPALRSACDAALAAEQTITQYDLLMGDGDCGEAVAGICKSILASLSSVEANPPPVLELLESIADKIEDAGGSLGAILSILATAFTNALSGALAGPSPQTLDLNTVAAAASTALENLKKYTAAREGDRTVMDVLIPFVRALGEGGGLERAVGVAVKKAGETSDMVPRFGRATYVGEGMGEGRRKVPDPGAWAVGVWLQGLVDVM